MGKKDLGFLLPLALSRSTGCFSPSQPRVWRERLFWHRVLQDRGRSPVEQFLDAMPIAGVFGADQAVHLGHSAGHSGQLERAKEKLEAAT